MGNIANGLKEAAKVVALLGGTGICVAGTYGMAKEAWRSYQNGRYGNALFYATSAGSGACLAATGMKIYASKVAPSTFDFTPEGLKAITDAVNAAK